MPNTQSTEAQPAASAAPATGRPPFRADHVGSLLRPPDLLRARDAAAAGRISGEELRAAEDTAIREVVRRQQEVGLASATDGELRRESWHMDFIYQLGGIKKVQDDTIRVAFHNKQKDYEWAPPSAHVVAPLTLEHTIFGDAFTFLADTVGPAVPKLTIPSLSMVHYRGGRSAIDESVYPDLGQFWADLAAAYAEEVRRLYDLGCRYLQLDDTSLAYMNDPAQRQHVAEIGGDPEHQHEQYIANINRALAGRPPDLAVTTHMCRGNNQSMWAAEGGYDFVAEALFNDLDVDGFFCEWDDERSGGFEPLRFVPKGKRVVLGLVTTKRGELESKDELKRRIDAAARFLDIDQLCLSPQCGFSSTKEGNDITPDQQWAKLALIVETAQEVWGLWPDARGCLIPTTTWASTRTIPATARPTPGPRWRAWPPDRAGRPRHADDHLVRAGATTGSTTSSRSAPASPAPRGSRRSSSAASARGARPRWQRGSPMSSTAACRTGWPIGSPTSAGSARRPGVIRRRFGCLPRCRCAAAGPATRPPAGPPRWGTPAPGCCRWESPAPPATWPPRSCQLADRYQSRCLSLVPLAKVAGTPAFLPGNVLAGC
ncbi:MAG: 5-methyltetrahydropteroyltriglutamate--homocysteine S-methyltransferase [Streptosporangiaceae bacterium]